MVIKNIYSPQYLHATFLLSSGQLDISCDKQVADTIERNLSSPSEELFDGAEEYVLSVLFDAWSTNMRNDSSSFNRVSVISFEMLGKTQLVLFAFWHSVPLSWILGIPNY